LGDRHHQRVPARSQAELERGRVQQDPVAHLRPAGQRRVGQRGHGGAAGRHLELDHARPLPAHRSHHRIPPSDHPGTVAWTSGNLRTRDLSIAGGQRGENGALGRCREKAAMSKRKTERLLSLVVCLLSSQRYLTATQIRAAVPGYPDSFDAFKRMFERDKEELRALGIPLDMGTNGTLDDEGGYRIPRQAYVLPDIRLEPYPSAVLPASARPWDRAER